MRGCAMIFGSLYMVVEAFEWLIASGWVCKVVCGCRYHCRRATVAIDSSTLLFGPEKIDTQLSAG